MEDRRGDLASAEDVSICVVPPKVGRLSPGVNVSRRRDKALRFHAGYFRRSVSEIRKAARI
jgi:hypothetical protein